jgi:hypothetical protein
MLNFFRTLAPEQFDAKVEIHSDGTYAYSYDGILIFVPALIRAERGALDARMETQLKEAALQLRREGFQRAEYLGSGRYAVLLEQSRSNGEPSYFPSREMRVFSIKPRPDGAITIDGSRPDATAPCQLTGTNAELDGTLIVTLDKGVEVLKHNAQHTRPIHGLFGGYQWRIKSPDADPFIIVLPAR